MGKVSILKYVFVFLAFVIVLAGGWWALKFKKIESNKIEDNLEVGRIEIKKTTAPQISETTEKETKMSLTITDSTGGVIKGKTTPGAEVFVDDKETKADAQGNFSVTLSLDEGENLVVVTSNDELGNYAEEEVTVTI